MEFPDTSKTSSTIELAASEIVAPANESIDSEQNAEQSAADHPDAETSSREQTGVDLTATDQSGGDPSATDQSSDLPSAPPPSYESVFSRVKSATIRKAATRPTEDKIKLSKRFRFQLVCYIISSETCLAVFGVLMLLAVVHIVIGSMYLHYCRLEKLIPIFLVVFGVFALMTYGLVFYTLRLWSADEDGDSDAAVFSSCCVVILAIFLVVWLIAGSVYVFGPYTTWGTNISLPTFCEPTLYYYAFWSTIATYILIVGVPIGLCCFFLAKSSEQ